MAVYKKVTLCGSVKRSYIGILHAAAVLTKWGFIVHAPFRVNENINSNMAVRLDGLHRAKIQESHAVIIMRDTSRYIGKSTKGEIEYTERLHKPLFFWTHIGPKQELVYDANMREFLRAMAHDETIDGYR